MGALTEDVHFTQRIEFPAKAENITLAEKLIDEACARYNVPESLYGNILIALTEAVNNAIHHGNAAHRDHDRVLPTCRRRSPGASGAVDYFPPSFLNSSRPVFFSS